MSSPITTGTSPKLLWPGIHAIWGNAYNEHPTEYTDLFDTETSDKAYEEDVEMVGFGVAPIKREGASVAYQTERQGTTTRYTHFAVASGYIVTYEELQDNLYMQVSKRRAKSLAFGMRQTKEIYGANIYNRAFNSTYAIADGAALISASHPNDNGNQSNILTTSADLSEKSIEDLCVQIMLMTDSRGNRISGKPVSLHVPSQLWYNANRILNSTLQSATANNAVNVLKAQGTFPGGIKVNHYFDSSSAWFIRTNIGDSVRHFTREAISFKEDNDFDTKNLKYACYERYSFGVTNWRGVYGTAGA